MSLDHCLVSIVISSHNYAAYIGDAIRSALEQSHAQTEVIVVDNGSTDGSHEVIASFGDAIKARLQQDRGQGGAYNVGFEMSRGEFVIFLDADDVLEPNAVARILEAFRPDVGKVQYRLAVVDQVGRRLGRTLPSYDFADEAIPEHLARYGFYVASPGSGNAFRRSLLAKILPMPEDRFMIGADGYVGGLAPYLGRIVSIDEALVRYRVHGENNSEAGRVDAAKLRRMIDVDDARATAQHVFVQRNAAAPLPGSALNIPGYCKQRLLSCMLEPKAHPYPGDRVGALAWHGAIAAWRFPPTTLLKKALSSLAFLALPLIPRGLLARRLPALVAGFHRPQHRRHRRSDPAKPVSPAKAPATAVFCV